MTAEERIAQLEAELAEERASRQRLEQALMDTCAVLARGQPQEDRAYPSRPHVRLKPGAREWHAAHPGVPMPRAESEDVPPHMREEFDIPLRLRTPDEQAQWEQEEEARMAPIRAARAEEARLRARRRVYFIQAGAAGPVKIGISRDVERRRGELQRLEREPLRVLATLEGTTQDERALHQRFAAHRLHGEWFSPAPELLAHVAALNGRKE